MKRIRHIAMLVAMLWPGWLLWGCTTIPDDQVQGQLTRTVSERIAQPVDWRGNEPEDQIIGGKVRQMLADELTLNEAIAIALVNNRGLRAVLTRVGVARADLVQAGLFQNPVFEVSLLDGDAGTEVEYSLLQDFLGIFTLSARRKMAGAELERTRLEVAQAALDLVAEVKHAYYALLAERQALEMYRQAVDSTEAAAELARRQFTAGTLSLRDQALQQSFFAQAALEAARAEARFGADREKLNSLLGLWGLATAWQLPPRLPEIPSVPPDLDALERQAVTLRLDLAARRAEVEAANTALGHARQTGWLSAFGLGFTVKRDVDGSHSNGPNLSLGLPLVDRGQGRMARLESELAAAEYRYGQLAVDVRAEVRAAAVRLSAAHAAAAHYRNAILPLAERVVSETLKFYNGMLVGVYELLSAKQAQIGAARDYIAAWRDFWIAWSDLERALGRALPAGPPDTPQDRPQHRQGG